jgi:hypothetical protein
MHNSQITMEDDFSMKNLKYRFSEAKLKKNNNHCALCTVNCELKSNTIKNSQITMKDDFSMGKI